ncbi:MAG: DNA polymerase I [Alicyclobacillus herbarius]|uniref:DNA polymerase I n=1 Tax=Alicyclobacillus herbarius TaxID=122960 RepID=UPI0023521B32|nr:DNA polymerase I [Alicyclobacillus herbarius]MCL6631108.1 DNA polymerase I [Alicyclobacillus herbarius]
MTSPSSKLVLIDGNSITYRAFFALPSLSNARGQFTNAVFGFTQMLLRLLQDEQPTHIAVAFDVGKTTFRHQVFDAYKGTRQKTPSELSEQFPLVREVLKAFRIPIIELENYEADDLIGTLSRIAEAQGLYTLVVSGDRDLLQLVSDTVHAAVTRKGITEMDRYDVEAVRARFELSPAQIVDLKGLMGDSSDNIPGVPGVGEKTAIKLLKQYETVENVLNHIEEVSGKKLQERLKEHREEALLSKQLATICREAPIDVTLDELKYSGYDPSAVRRVFLDLGFQSLVDRISGEIDNPDETGVIEEDRRAAAADLPVDVITHSEQLTAFWDSLRSPCGVLIDFADGDYQTADIRGIAIGLRDKGYYISFAGDLGVADVERLWSDDVDKVVFDIKALAVALDSHGHTLTLDDTWDDTMIGSYLLNPSDGEPSLADILERELQVRLDGTLRRAAGAKVTGRTAITAGGRDKKTASEGQATDAEEQAAEAAARIASLLLQLNEHIQDALSAQELDGLYRDVELPLALVLARMEALGFSVNADWLRDYGKELTGRIAALEQEIYRLAGCEFNINSPKQLGDVLFDKLGLPAMKKTKTGYSTSADVLEKLAPYHEVVERILEFRQLGKLQSTYVDGLLKVIRPETGRVHTRFHQTLTATGRLSSSDPNLQNIPIRMEEGRRLRQAFAASYEDWSILSADYSQIELRILAHLSGDEALIEAFRQGMDIHTRTAADVFEVSPDEVTPLMRRQAKAVNFGIVYGISDYGLSQNLGIPRKQAAEFIEGYFAKFPGVKRYMDEIVETAKQRGYVTTLLNRRRYLPDIRSRNYNLRSFAERTAMNTPIQGTAADIIKLAMVRIDEALHNSGLKARMLLQVHDELIFECPDDELDALRDLVEEKMENAMVLSVPLKVDVHAGKTWYEAK